MAYPGPVSSVTALVGRDAFLDALGNQRLRVRILEKEPTTLEEALRIASRLEAFERTNEEESDFHHSEPVRKNGRHIRSLVEHDEASHKKPEVPELLECIKTLCEKLSSVMPASQTPLNQATPGISSAASSSTSSSNSSWTDDSGSRQNRRERNSGRNSNDERGQRKGSVVCYACGQSGHIRRNCTNRQNEEENTDNASRLQLIINRSPENYIRAFIRGKPVTCLLDTGVSNP